MFKSVCRVNKKPIKNPNEPYIIRLNILTITLNLAVESLACWINLKVTALDSCFSWGNSLLIQVVYFIFHSSLMVSKNKYIANTFYCSYNSSGKPSGSLKNVNFLLVNSSILMSSTSTPCATKCALTNSTELTLKAKCLNPSASG